MPRPDKETVIEKLQELLGHAQNFEKRNYDFRRTADFANWLSDVGSWLRAGSPHTDDQYSDFLNLRFEPIGYASTSYRRDAEERWQRDLKKAQHSIKRAIENIQRDWTVPDGNAPTATNPTTGDINISGGNVTIAGGTIKVNQISLADFIRASLPVIEERAESPEKAGKLKDLLSRAISGPLGKILTTIGVGEILKHV